MSVQSEITRLSDNVTAALAAIADKGVTVPDGSNSDSLAALIESIEAGGGSGNFATGAFTTTDDITSNVVINHNLGVKPKFMIVLSAKDSAYTSSKPKMLSFCYIYQHNSINYGLKFQNPGSSTASYSKDLINGSENGNTGAWYRVNVDETTFTLKQANISSTYGIGASSSFFWIAYGE